MDEIPQDKKPLFPKELTTVTKVSKTVALIMFIALPIVGFFYGRNYQSSIDNYHNSSSINEIINVKYKTITPTWSNNLPSNSVESTANWKVYTDKKIGASFKYPNWSIVQDTENNSIKTVQFQILGSMFIYERQTDKGINPGLLQVQEGQTINGVFWHKMQGRIRTEFPSTSIAYYTIENGYLYSFHGPIDSGDLLEKVISTFSPAK